MVHWFDGNDVMRVNYFMLIFIIKRSYLFLRFYMDDIDKM